MLDATTSAPCIGITDDCEPIFQLPNGVETTDRCIICAGPFDPRPSNIARQVTCGGDMCKRAHHQNLKRAARNKGKPPRPSEVPCAVCGTAFKPLQPTGLVCQDEECRDVAKRIRWHRWALGPGIAERKKMLPETIAGNLSALLARCAHPESFHVPAQTSAAAASSPPASPAVEVTPNPPLPVCPEGAAKPEPIDPEARWLLPAPTFDRHLPAIAAPVTLSPPRALTLLHTNALHAAITYALDRSHHANIPDWSLQFVEQKVSPSCVVACFRHEADVAALRSQWPLRLGTTEMTATVGRPWQARLKTPAAPAPGRYRVAIDTVTPVVIKRSVPIDGTDKRRNVHHAKPIAWNLISTLSSTLAPRLGVSILREHLAVEIVDARCDHTRDVLRGGRRIRIHAAGWEGRIVVDVNAPALWLLECAERGMGLGGRVAFGFGQIRLTRLPANDVEAPPPPAPLAAPEPAPVVPVRRDVVEAFSDAATPPARRVRAASGEPARPREPVAPAAPPVVTEVPIVGRHAVRRYVEWIHGKAFPRSWVEQDKLHAELQAIVELCVPHQPRPDHPEAHRVKDAWLWVGPRVGGPRAARLRIVVGRSVEPGENLGKLVVVTVLPLHDAQGASTVAA